MKNQKAPQERAGARRTRKPAIRTTDAPAPEIAPTKAELKAAAKHARTIAMAEARVRRSEANQLKADRRGIMDDCRLLIRDEKDCIKAHTRQIRECQKDIRHIEKSRDKELAAIDRRLDILRGRN